MKLNLEQYEKLWESIDFDSLKFEKKIIDKNKNTKGYTYELYNTVCACNRRIRETSEFINNYSFDKSNDNYQAFSFIFLITCIDIIKESVTQLFTSMSLNINDFYKKKKVFKISNKTNENDISFFNFIRSASYAHPTSTTRHVNIKETPYETYPFISWINPLTCFFGNKKYTLGDDVIGKEALKRKLR